LCITGSLHLVSSSLGESNTKHPQCVTISCLHIHMGFDKSLPFSNQRPQFVCGEIHSLENWRLKDSNLIKKINAGWYYEQNWCSHQSYPEICQDILPLNVFSSQPNLPERMILISLKISQWDLKHSMFEPFRSNLQFETTTVNISI